MSPLERSIRHPQHGGQVSFQGVSGGTSPETNGHLVHSVMYEDQSRVTMSNVPDQPDLVALHSAPRGIRCHRSPSIFNLATQDEPSILPRDLQQHVDAFFKYVAPYQANGLLYRGTIKRQIRDGCASQVLLLAICAITTRFLPGRETSTTQLSNQQSCQ